MGRIRLQSIPESDLERLVAAIRDHAAFCEHALQIRDKTGQTVPLVLTPAQRKLADAVDRQERAGQPVRIVVLKARQVHMSVGACSLIFRRTAFLPGQQTMIFGDLYKSAKNLWGYCYQFDQSYRPYLGLKKLALAGKQTHRRLDWEQDSWLEVQSADSVTTGRSYSLRHLLLSEYAFYRDAGTLMTGLMQTVPDDADTTIIVESTANGLGNPFHQLWERASDANSKSGWLPVFFAWWEHPEYSRALDEPMAYFERTLTAEEQALRRQFQLTLEQINWRRWAIAAKCEGSLDRFRQEYPSTPEEAFLTSGRPRFCMVSIGRQPRMDHPLAGELERVQAGTREVLQFLPRADGSGALRVWKRPAEGHKYVIGADPSKGRDVGSAQGRTDPDYSCAQVIDADTGEQVAVLRARLTPYEFAQYAADLARWYGHAYIVPESNELGFIEGLLQTRYPMDRIYRRQREADDRRTPRLEELGWLTTTASKPQLISILDRALREFSVVVHDPVTLSELRTFVYKPNGRQEAQDGCHDDCVIALALAMVGLMTMPRLPARDEWRLESEFRPMRYGRKASQEDDD